MEHFDQMAKHYDTHQRRDRAVAIFDAIFAHIQHSKSQTVMEYGCGTGLVGMQLAPHVASMVFVDASQAMIEQVRSKIEAAGITHATAVCQDILASTENLPPVDTIFMSLVLHHIHDVQGILCRLHMLLNEGGHLLVVDLNRDDGSFHAEHPHFDGHHGFDQAELIAQCEKAGFHGATAQTFYRGSKQHADVQSDYSLFLLDCRK